MLVLLLVSGCGGQSKSSDSYEAYYNRIEKKTKSEYRGMAEDLAVVQDKNGTTAGTVSADYADLCIDDTDNKVLVAYHCFDKRYPASITKVMTALLTLEHGHLDDKITLKHDIVLGEEGAVISSLKKGDTVTVSQVLHTMLIKSANDCAVILGEYIAGSEDAFVDMMNAKAKELGATHTHFVNPNGLHDDNHYTTA